jgi:hypothetical protein
MVFYDYKISYSLDKTQSNPETTTTTIILLMSKNALRKLLAIELKVNKII